MLFNSFEFLIFLPIVFFAYWFCFRKRTIQNLFLVVASYFFYGYWDYRFLFLIFATSLFSYISGIFIQLYETNKKAKRIVTVANITLNLLILAVFKYFNFFSENLILIFNQIGYKLDDITINVVLPVGISFYTFQALSYTIDVYNKRIEPTKDIVAFFAYICFFPQLVAGPIERATHLLPQFQKGRHFDYEKAVDGMRQLLWGFFKKMVVADNCAFIVNLYWDNYFQLNGLTLLVLGILFSFQIYCDFSGYSDIAIGCARLFGFDLKRNFDFPYFSRNIPEFWRKWHISLTSWFRDYLYIPLGGNRCKKWKVIRNIVIVWALSGLWHGANWTFIVWGLYHAIILSIYVLLNIKKRYNTIVANGKLFPSFIESIEITSTFFLAVLGWIIFRSKNIQEAYLFISRLFTTLLSSIEVNCGKGLIYLLIGVFVLFIEWIQRDKQHALQFQHNKIMDVRAIRWSIYISIILMMLFFHGNSQTFLYFQF